MLSLYLIAYYYALNYASIMSWGLLSMSHIHYETNIHLNIHYKTIIMHSLQCGNYFKSLQIVSMRYYYQIREKNATKMLFLWYVIQHTVHTAKQLKFIQLVMLLYNPRAC